MQISKWGNLTTFCYRWLSWILTSEHTRKMGLVTGGLVNGAGKNHTIYQVSVSNQRRTWVPAVHHKFVGKKPCLYCSALEHALVLVEGDKNPAWEWMLMNGMFIALVKTIQWWQRMNGSDGIPVLEHLCKIHQCSPWFNVVSSEECGIVIYIPKREHNLCQTNDK